MHASRPRTRSPPSTSTSYAGSPTSPSTALAAAREEIDALNVYPVPDGDTGTNMFLTVESARDALRRALRGAPGRPAGRDAGLLARGAARRPGQLRGDPEPARRRPAAADRPGRPRRPVGGGVRRGDGAGHRRGVRRGRASRSRAPSSPSPGPPREAAAAAAAELPDDRLGAVVHAAAARRPRGAGPHARAAAPARGGRGRRRRRPRAVRGARRRRVGDHRQARHDRCTPAGRHRGDPGGPGPHRRPDRGRPGLRGDVPPRGRRRRHPRAARASWRRSATRSSWSAARGCGTCTSTSTTSGAAVEAGIRAGSPRRIEVTHFAEQVARARRASGAERRGRAAGRSWRPGRAWSTLFREAGAEVHRGRARAAGRAPASSWRRSRPPAPRRSIVLPNDPDTIGVAEAAAHEAEARGHPRRGDPDPRPGAGHRRAGGARARPARWTATSCR